MNLERNNGYYKYYNINVIINIQNKINYFKGIKF